MNRQISMLRQAIASLALIATCASHATMAMAQDLPSLPKAIKDAGVIRIGVKCDSPPFGSSGPDGKPVGVEVEMAKKIGTYAFGSPDKAELSCVATDARIPSLTGGKIDLIIATLGKTPPREQVIDYSDIYYWGGSNVIVPKESPVQKLAELEGKSILIVKGGNQLKWLRDRIPGIQFVQLNTNADNIQALLQGRADGYVGDAVTIATLISNYPNLRVLKEEVDLGFNGVGIRKNEPELKAFVNATLRKLKEEKFYSQVVPNYVSDPIVAKEMIKSFETDPPAAN
ncbi:transporter substrate-binding domain-containing protein [Microvirga lotononidis]|uniref:Periplasmic component of amino acid ABC-type transporter/signal transduction system n=1 Tax=Microvirga lotononidis TaxID=864069 RepID=I4YPH5_9HYPH|nr:transporter substrate-binding domain-containing protein [Microvirga lotononidis]EIM25867.1 periplasmic component of amino acid ABC-type transporter/signal transduction system [Microvirga lotononidis]WQO25787.1 transporter substrate-binding domain-containing protein [Microvirga lotononidis]